MIAALVYVWFLGLVAALFLQATNRREVPPGERIPALVAVVLAFLWPITLLYMAIENREEWRAAIDMARTAWKIGRWDPADVDEAKRRLRRRMR